MNKSKVREYSKLLITWGSLELEQPKYVDCLDIFLTFDLFLFSVDETPFIIVQPSGNSISLSDPNLITISYFDY